ncbi:MAG: hypothetical protein IT210_11730 [Armatimonadetes bacterium]|nr:hypothetical protein [Armatimonadota bacterium]
MAIPIVRSDLKELLMIPASETGYDTAIDNHITRALPVIEYQIRDSSLADVSAGLQATLTLGALEVLAGQFWNQMNREEGASEVKIFSLQSDPEGDFREAKALEEKGWARLAPYLKNADALPVIVPVEEEADGSLVFSARAMEVW